MNLFAIKLLLLFFWSAWFSVVFLTNAFEGLKLLGVLPGDWKFASENYEVISGATSVYALPEWANRVLFYGVVAWQALVVILLWAATFRSWTVGRIDPGRLVPAFTAALGLWAAFMLADEIFRDYKAQGTHLTLLIAQLGSLLAIVLLPS